MTLTVKLRAEALEKKETENNENAELNFNFIRRIIDELAHKITAVYPRNLTILT